MSSEPQTPIIAGSLADLPDHAEGARHLVWWGNLGFMLIEGMGFALAAGVYLYLQSRSNEWPPAGIAPPGLGWSAVFTASLLFSALPNFWVLKQAQAKNTHNTRRGVLAMTVIGLVLAGFRAMELQHLNIRWDANGYGSAVWLLMVLHTSHVITDLGDTAVQALWLYTHKIGDDQFADVEDNANYWSFVVLTWVPIYGLIYWLPRLS